MAKKKVFNTLTLNIVLITIILLVTFGIIVATIGYTEFNDTLTERYNDAAYTTAQSVYQFITGEEVEYYFTVGKANYDAHAQELYDQYKAEYGDQLEKDKAIWKQYVYDLENYLPNDAPEYRRDRYRNIKSNLQDFCENQDVAILYVVVPISDDYSEYCSVVDCVNALYLPYNEWLLGANGASQKHAANSEYNELYKNIMENGLQRATVAVKKPSSGSPYINSLVPIYKGTGENKEVVGIVVVQQTMTLLRKWGKQYTLLIAITTIVLVVLSVVVFALIIRRQFVLPIHRIRDEAQRFAKENSEPEVPIDGEISKIHEISSLADAIGQMEDDTLKYIRNLSQAVADKQKITSELNIAQAIQQASLETNFTFPDRSEFELFASMTPAKQVGGDFYDFFLIDDDHIGLVIADVSGKGVPAALFMMVTKILINERAMTGGTPAEILEIVNKRICARNLIDMFVTVWFGILEISTGKIIAANAGHDSPAVMKNGRFEYFKAKRGLVVGGMAESKYKNFEFTLEKGDKIFLFTDGVPEATNRNGQMFTLERLNEFLNAHVTESPKEIIDSINAIVDKFVDGAPQFDDITMLCLEYKGKSSDSEKVLTIGANIKNLPEVNDFVESFMDAHSASPKAKNQILLALEEVFANVAHYAYPPEGGNVKITERIQDGVLTLVFADYGVPYNPLEKEAPDITLPVEERREGGLGIFLTKKLVDNITYEHVDNQNILTLEKKL